MEVLAHGFLFLRALWVQAEKINSIEGWSIYMKNSIYVGSKNGANGLGDRFQHFYTFICNKKKKEKKEK